MSDDDFLTRWSRRKREAAKSEPPPAEPAAPAKAEGLAAETPAAPPETEPVDLASLPSLESITGSTDITPFLRHGVPEELRRSALRKMWTSDPAIRDFIEIAENQWDFNDPASIPGFGEIDFSPEQVRQMAARLVGDVERVAENVQAALEPDPAQHVATQNASSVSADASIPQAQEHPALQDENVAPQQEKNSPEEKNSPDETDKPPARARRHGGALPC
jgi:hypothetical protein